MEKEPNGKISVRLLSKIEVETNELVMLGVQLKLPSKEKDYSLEPRHKDAFQWVDNVNDYKDTEMYGDKLQHMEKWQWFLLEVFLQTKPEFQTAEARSAKYKPPVK